MYNFTCKKCGKLETVEKYDEIFKMGKICYSCNRKQLKQKDTKSITNNKKKNKIKKRQKQIIKSIREQENEENGY